MAGDHNILFESQKAYLLPEATTKQLVKAIPIYSFQFRGGRGGETFEMETYGIDKAHFKL